MAVFAAAMVGILLRPLGYLSVFWPANQIVLVLLLRYPQLVRPVAIAALFASFVLADLITGTALWHSLGFTTANLCGAICGWLFLRRQSQRDLQMEGQYSALLVFFASGMASLASALIGGPISAWAFELSVTQAVVMWWTGGAAAISAGAAIGTQRGRRAGAPRLGVENAARAGSRGAGDKQLPGGQQGRLSGVLAACAAVVRAVLPHPDHGHHHDGGVCDQGHRDIEHCGVHPGQCA